MQNEEEMAQSEFM